MSGTITFLPRGDRMPSLRETIRKADAEIARKKQEEERKRQIERQGVRDNELRSGAEIEQKKRSAMSYFNSVILPYIKEIADEKRIPLRSFESGIVGEIFGNGHGTLPSKPGYEQGCYFDSQSATAIAYGRLVWGVEWNDEHGKWNEVSIRVNDLGIVSGSSIENVNLTDRNGQGLLERELVSLMSRGGSYGSWSPEPSRGEGY